MKYWIFHTLQAIKRPFSSAARARRMDVFIERMKIKGGERIIDLGGAPYFWKDCAPSLDITIVNLPGFNPSDPGRSHHQMKLIDGDACNVEAFGDMSFDIAFSNSVIEHVGDIAKQAAMASEARRLAPAYWVQTPSIWFPIEAHNNMPFWWFYPQRLKKIFIRRWRKKLPEWTEMIEGTTVIPRADLKKMFPEGRVWTERVLGITKSYVLYQALDRGRGGS